MSKDLKSAHVTPADGSVFLDLGFDPKLAAALQAESEKIIVEKKAAKHKSSTEDAKEVNAQEL